MSAVTKLLIAEKAGAFFQKSGGMPSAAGEGPILPQRHIGTTVSHPPPPPRRYPCEKTPSRCPHFLVILVLSGF